MFIFSYVSAQKKFILFSKTFYSDTKNAVFFLPYLWTLNLYNIIYIYIYIHGQRECAILEIEKFQDPRIEAHFCPGSTLQINRNKSNPIFNRIVESRMIFNCKGTLNWTPLRIRKELIIPFHILLGIWLLIPVGIIKENTPSRVVRGGRSLSGIRRRIPTPDASKWSPDSHHPTSGCFPLIPYVLTYEINNK